MFSRIKTKERGQNERDRDDQTVLSFDDFSNRFHQMCSQKQIVYTKRKIRKKTFKTSLSEVLAILLLFHRSN
ncbi:hypothetical protein DB44_CH00020 [Candidatus Protochlamydia amoebophila]|uniref:Uncharacterized protein n=1 Tax=Candidatus Protochlamydia amoebophila TaxID=362787 RepID=A0A0C1JZ29_9BACT|nr:hypothetical protein DB44_CH00020 [Candidatus Protochlamydia amoebophila]